MLNFVSPLSSKKTHYMFRFKVMTLMTVELDAVYVSLLSIKEIGEKTGEMVSKVVNQAPVFDEFETVIFIQGQLFERWTGSFIY